MAEGGGGSTAWRRRSALPEPFRIGVSPLGNAPWLRLDGELERLRAGEPVVRGSWSLHADAVRFAPRHAPDHAKRLADGMRTGDALVGLHLRTERQVLQRLPRSGAVLFSIDTAIRPATSLGADERSTLAVQLGAMTPEQRAYRGLPIRQ